MADKDIRKRVSYTKFSKLYDELKDAPIEKQLETVFNLLDSMMAFRSASAATYAKESLDLLLKDKKETV